MEKEEKLDISPFEYIKKRLDNLQKMQSMIIEGMGILGETNRETLRLLLKMNNKEELLIGEKGFQDIIPE